MKIKTKVIGVVAVFVLAANPMVSMAQRSGFQIGIAQPSVAFAPTQAPAIATRGTFVANPLLPPASAPIVIIQNQVVVSNPVFIPNQVFTPNPVFVPGNGILDPNEFPVLFQTPTLVTNPVAAQMSVPTHILAPGQTVIPDPTVQPPFQPMQSHFGPPPSTQRPSQQQLTPPAVGTPRADVLQQLGRPLATVTTRTGETLFFDGITVTLQNGQVTGTK
jgi:hypothetical protein